MRKKYVENAMQDFQLRQRIVEKENVGIQISWDWRKQSKNEIWNI